MIDYEKLKLVYELSNKYKNEHNEYSIITHTYYSSNDYDFFTWTTYTYGEENYNNIDELIYEIQEKLKSKDEYKTGWYIYNWEPVATKVKNAVGYQFCDASDPESLGRVMYDSKSECLLSLIEHWNKLYLEELNKKESTVFLKYPWGVKND